MIEDFKLWWLHQKRKKSNRDYSKYVAQASRDEQEFRRQEAMNVRDEERDQILNLKSINLLDKAEYMSIPVPSLSDNESWESGLSPGTIRLTTRAQWQLRQAIRNETKEKWSVTALLISLGIGLLGAITGLLSIIHAFRSK